MITTAKEQYTASFVSEGEFSPETRRPRRGDWWYPERRSNQSNSTTTGGGEEQATPTELAEASRYAPPISKASVTVKLTGNLKKVLQQWECVVISKHDDVVCCEMHDLTDESSPVEYAEIFIGEFNKYDLPLLTDGAVFYWSIGHQRRQNGAVHRVSEIRVRRVPTLSHAQKAEITRKVERLSGLIFGK